MGSKGSTTTNTNQAQTYTPNPAINQAGNTALGMATNAAQQPFNLPVAPVAGFNPFQQQAFSQYQNLQGMAQPYYNQAQADIQGSAAPITGADVNQYYNPYASAVMANLAETQGQQMQDLTGRSTQTAGGVGADRIGVAQGELARQQNLATGQTASGIYQNALNAAQQQKQMQANAGYGLTNLGTTAQGAALQGTGALMGAGTQQQALSQAQLNAPYQNQLAQLAYPFQTAQYLAGITGNLAGPMGGTTTGYGTSQTTPPQPSIWSQLLGAGTAGIGAYGAFNSAGNPANSYGGGSAAAGDAYGGSSSAPLNGLSSSDYGFGYAAGGSTGSGFGNPEWMDADPIVPKMEMHPTSGQAHNNLNLTPPQQQQQSSSGGLGDIIGSVAKIAPLFLASSGGTVDANAPPFQAFEDGGTPFTPFENRWADAATMGEMPRAQALNHYINPTPDLGASVPERGYGILQDAMANKYGVNPNDAVRMPSPDDVAQQQAEQNRVLASNQPDQSGQQRLLVSKNNMPPPPPPSSPTGEAMGVPGVGGPMSRPPPSPQQERYPLDKQLPYPDLDAVHDTSRNFAKSPWTALMNAGFAMMAGTSPFAGVNIGKGMLAGTKTLEDQRKELASEEGINQHAKALMQQAQFHQDQYDKMTVFQDAQMRLKEQQAAIQAKLLETRGWKPGFRNDVEGSVTTYNPLTHETMKIWDDGRVEMGSLTNPGEVSKNPNTVTKDNTPSGSSTPAEAAPLHIPELASNLVPPKVDTSQYRKGSLLFAQANEDNKKVTDQHVKEAANMGASDIDLQDMKNQNRILMKDGDKDGFMTRLATMRGNNYEEKIAAARAANEARRVAHMAPVVDPEKLGAMELIYKTQKRLGLLFSSQISTREAFAGQQIGIDSTPGLTQSAAGMNKLIANFEAQSQYTKDKHAFYQNFIQANHGIPSGWQQAFEKQNSVDRYIARSTMENAPNPQDVKNASASVKYLREHRDDPRVIANFNRHYGNTADYWLTGRLNVSR